MEAAPEEVQVTLLMVLVVVASLAAVAARGLLAHLYLVPAVAAVVIW